MRSARMVGYVVGAAVMLGVLSGEASAAVISGRLSWGGVPVTGPAAAAMYMNLWCDGPPTEARTVPVQMDGTYRVDFQYPGDGQCYLSVIIGRPADAVGAQVARQYFPGLPSPTDFDLTNTTGWVRGTLTGQGVAEVNYHVPVDTEGRFEFLGAPGLLSLRPVAASGDEISLYSFTFPVVAGQTTDLGTLATEAASEGWGALTAETTWRGQPVFVPGLFVAAGRTVVASASPPTSVGLFPAGPLELAFLADDMPRPCPGGCLNSKPKLAQAPVVVSAAQTSRAQVELGGTVGRLRGQLTLDGVSVPFENPMPHGPNLRLRPGSVDLLLVAGTYTVGVEIDDLVVPGGVPVLVGELTFSITAGQTTDLGSRDFHNGGRGYVSATATWNGGPPYEDYRGTAPLVLTGPTLLGWLDTGMTSTVGQLAVGTPETLEVHSGGCGVHGDASDRLGQVSVTVPSANQVLPLALDLTSWAGRVGGTVEIDGLRPGDDWRPVVIGVDDSPCFWKPTNGVFNVLLAPGPHTVTVRDFEDIVHLRPLAQLSVTVVAGTITDMGLIAVTTPSDAMDAGVPQDPPPDGGAAEDGGAGGAPNPWDPPACVPRGAEMCNEVDDDCDGRINQGLSCNFEFATVHGTVTWGGAPIAGVGVAALRQQADVDASGKFLFRTKFVPGPLPLELTNGEGCVVARPTANVVAPATEASLDLNPWVGHLVGSLRWNDGVLLNPEVATRCGFEIDADSGKIGGYPRPGTSTFLVCDASPPELCSTFSVMVRAGEQANVTVEARTAPLDGSASLAFHGGLGKVGGLTVAFPQQAGSVPAVTTSVATDVGPPPPPDLQVLRAEGRPRYWSLTASDFRPIKGPVRVCMRYDEGDVRGHESGVRVLQWTGGSAEDITDSRDPAANVVCGTRTHIDGPGDPLGDEPPDEPTFFAVAGDKLPGPPRPSGCSLLAGQAPALAGWSSALVAALALFGRRKKTRR